MSARTPEGLFRAFIPHAAPVTTPELSSRFSAGSALRGHDLSSREERSWRKTRQRTHGSLETPSSKTGSPPKPSVSGFGGERRSSGVSELFALGRKRGMRSLRRRSANAFALTNRFPAPSHWCLARILTSGGVPELRPQCLQRRDSGQPLGNSFPKKRSLPLVLRRFVPTAPGGGAQQHRRKSFWGASTAVECRNCNRKNARFHLFGVFISSFLPPPL